MVDRQTPTVESDEELTREAEAERETEAERESESRPAADARRAIDARPETGSEAGAVPRAEGTVSTSPESGTTPESRTSPESGAGRETALFDRGASRDLQERWLMIQTEFVDEPRKATEKAEQLVSEVMKTLTDSFARERRNLEARWSGDREVSTEDLRQAIRRYRSFFNRLLSL